MCLLGALFTLCSHLVVGLGGSLFWLLLVFALACGAAAFVARRLPAPATARESAAGAPGPQLRWPRLLGATLGCAALVGFVANDSAVTLFVGGLLALGVGLSALEPSVAPRAALESREHERALLVIGLLCGAYALIAHRPDAGDALFASLAVGAEGRMDLPLLASDTLHGRDDLPLHASLYRLQSYELAVAAVAWVTRVPPLAVLHFLAAGLAAGLVPLAHAELFRRLTPRHWLASVVLLVLLLVFGADTERGYGNAAFLRIWQGDGLFLFVLTPLLYSYSMRYAQTPSRRGLLRLAAAQIAALGCSAHAVWVAPVMVLGGLLSGAPLSGAGLARAARGLLPSLYGVAALFALGASLGLDGGEPRAAALGARLDAGISQVLGNGRLALFCLAAALTAWTCCPPGLSRRFAVFAPLVALLSALDPWLGEWLHRHVAGHDTWRALWTLPVPLLVTLVLVAPLELAVRLPRSAALAGSAALCALFVLALPARYGFSAANGVELRAPGLKVPSAAYRQASLLHEHAAGRRVVAPPDVSVWLPTFRNPAHPLMVLPYLDPERVGTTAYRDRYVMSFFAGGEARHVEARELFARGLELYGVEAALIRLSEHIDITRRLLRRAGYQRRVQASDFEIWARDRGASGAR